MWIDRPARELWWQVDPATVALGGGGEPRLASRGRVSGNVSSACDIGCCRGGYENHHKADYSDVLPVDGCLFVLKTYDIDGVMGGFEGHLLSEV